MFLLRNLSRNLSNISFHKLKRQDAELSKLFISLSKPNTRPLEQRIVLEGQRLIKEALSSDLSMDYLLFSKDEHLDYIENAFGVDKLKDTTVIKVPYSDLKLWSQMTTFSGIMGVFKKPNINEQYEHNLYSALPITVICDNIREPNNLGSIIRTCAAIPCKKIIVAKGCANPWETKCLRGGAGGHFHVPVFGPLTWEEITRYHLDVTEQICVADNDASYGVSFDEMQYKSNVGKTLVIGGETHGVSAEAKELCAKLKGSHVHIPMANHVESLNTAAAVSIILFDMKIKCLKHNLIQ